MGPKAQDSLWPSVTVDQAPCAVSAIGHETQAKNSPPTAPSPPPALAGLNQREEWGLGTGLGHGCGSQGTTFTGTSPSTQGMTAAKEQVTGRTWVSCTQLLSGASWAVLATMGGTGSPDLSCLVSEAPPGAQGCSHVVQHLRLHLVFTPVGRLEVLLLLLLVLPRLVCQLLFATVSLGWAGEESRPLGADGLPDHE